MSSSLKRSADDQLKVLGSGDGDFDRTTVTESPSEGADGHRKKKKKRKSRHQQASEESSDSARPKHKRRSGEGQEEWPSLVSKREEVGNLYKRKSSVDLESDSQQPKVLREEIKSERSFADELASFKSYRDKSKKRKEKKEAAKLKEEGNIKTEQDVQDKQGMPRIENVDELKKMLRARKQQLKEIPSVRLKASGKEADLRNTTDRVPVLPGDVQSFLLLSQLGHDTTKYPKWVELKKFNRLSKTVVLVVEGASMFDYLSHESSCAALSSADIKAEMVSPYCYNCGVVEELCAVPLTGSQRLHLERKYGKEICPEALLTDKVIKVLRSAFSISSVPKSKPEAVEQKISVPTTDKFPRTELLLSAWQLIEEGYPLPFGQTELGDRYPDYVMSKDQYTEVTPSSPLWALDCEMCLTKAGNELTRVSVVNEQHKTVYESFCLPPNPIINYLTEYSGITAEMLRDVKTTLADIQRDLKELFPPDVILVGQSLNGDLHALKMMHPYIIDTSVIFNLTGVRRHKSKLSKLSEEFLNELIQQGGADGHDSVEDSLAALKLVQHKLTKSIEYGDAVLAGLDKLETPNTDVPPEHSAGDFDDLRVEVGPTMATSLFKHFTMHNRSVCVVGQEETLAEYSTFTAAAHRENKQLMRTLTTDNNQQTIAKLCSASKSNHFTLGHVVLSEEEDINMVDSWFKSLYDSPPFNSLFIVVLVGSHSNFANGAVLLKVKKPNLRLK